MAFVRLISAACFDRFSMLELKILITKNPPESALFNRLSIPPNTIYTTSWWNRKKKKELKLPWDMANSEALDRLFLKFGQFMPLNYCLNLHINEE